MNKDELKASAEKHGNKIVDMVIKNKTAAIIVAVVFLTAVLVSATS